MEQQETVTSFDEVNVDKVNIEEIMQAIRAQILAKKAATAGDGAPVVQVQGKRLPAEFYEHLYEAGLSYDQIHTQVHVTKIGIPVIGPILERLRQKFHELVVFYVNQTAANQIRINTHLLQAINILGEELEKREAGDQA